MAIGDSEMYDLKFVRYYIELTEITPPQNGQSTVTVHIWRNPNINILAEQQWEVEVNGDIVHSENVGIPDDDRSGNRHQVTIQASEGDEVLVRIYPSAGRDIDPEPNATEAEVTGTVPGLTSLQMMSCDYTGPSSIKNFNNAILTGEVTLNNLNIIPIDADISVMLGSFEIGSRTVTIDANSESNISLTADIEPPLEVDGLPDRGGVNFNLDINGSVFKCGSLTIETPDTNVPRNSIGINVSDGNEVVFYDIENPEDIPLNVEIQTNITRLSDITEVYSNTSTITMEPGESSTFSESVDLGLGVGEEEDFEVCIGTVETVA